MSRTCVITGAGSGVGRAVALALGKLGWKMALMGRRAEFLQETARLSGLSNAACSCFPCDIGDAKAVSEAANTILQQYSDVEVLVNAAGTNVPRRSLEMLAIDDYHAMIDTNLNGAYYCVQAFLPRMRQSGHGTIINVVSDAGKQASPKAGPGYVMSKFGLAGLTQSINAEERGNGIRACAIFPGDIDTPLLERRPNPPSAEARIKMLQPEDVAECVLLAINLPGRAIAEEIIIRPR